MAEDKCKLKKKNELEAEAQRKKRLAEMQKCKDKVNVWERK